jgi:hypothetical protein
VQLVVQLAAEAHLERVGPGFHRLGEVERGPLHLGVERDVGHPYLEPAVAVQRRAVDRQLERVHDHLVDPLVHLDGDRDPPREGRCVEVGLQYQVVPGRHDGAGKPVAVLHRAADYRAAGPVAPGRAPQHPAHAGRS